MGDFLKRVSQAQAKLKAPKSQYNSFGKYHYRSCEDILEAAKPICNDLGLVLNVSDKVVYIGERYYVEATATLFDTESNESIHSTAVAREAEIKKGMDESQISGTASSYARKYALNGLFNIDDTKDADTDEHKGQISQQKEYKCFDCGKPFEGFTDKNGKVFSAAETYQLASKANSDLRARCKDCKNKHNGG